MNISEQTDTYEVLTDGHTVWVNDVVRCLGRFGRFSAEIVVRDGRPITIINAQRKTSRTEWSWFRDAIRRQHGIIVEETFRPEYIQ